MKYLPEDYPSIRVELEEFYNKLEVYNENRTFLNGMEMKNSAHDLFCMLKANQAIGNISPIIYEDITNYCKEIGSHD